MAISVVADVPTGGRRHRHSYADDLLVAEGFVLAVNIHDVCQRLDKWP
jgi:hypothetical protein